MRKCMICVDQEDYLGNNLLYSLKVKVHIHKGKHFHLKSGEKPRSPIWSIIFHSSCFHQKWNTGFCLSPLSVSLSLSSPSCCSKTKTYSFVFWEKHIKLLLFLLFCSNMQVGVKGLQHNLILLCIYPIFNYCSIIPYILILSYEINKKNLKGTSDAKTQLKM